MRGLTLGPGEHEEDEERALRAALWEGEELPYRPPDLPAALPSRGGRGTPRQVFREQPGR